MVASITVGCAVSGADSRPGVARARRKWYVWSVAEVSDASGSVWRRRRWLWWTEKLAMSSPWGWREWLVFGGQDAIEEACTRGRKNEKRRWERCDLRRWSTSSTLALANHG